MSAERIVAFILVALVGAATLARVSRRGRSPLFALFLTVFLDLLGFGMIIPILPLYAKHFQVSDLAVTSMGASYSVMQLLFSTVWGRVSDKYGRRPVLMVSIAGSALSQLGYALAPNFAVLVLARMVAGICGANVAAAQAYIADITDEKSRAKGMGMFGMAMGLGFVFGPFFGGVLGHADKTLPFFVASALALVNLVAAYFTLPEPSQRKTGRAVVSWSALANTVSTPRVRALIVVTFVVTFGFSNLEQTFPFYLERRFGWGPREVGYVFAGLGVMMVLTQGVLVRRLVGRLGEKRLVVLGTGLLALGMLGQWAAHGLALLVVNVVLIAIDNGLNSPSLSSLISRATTGDRQGGVLGVTQSMSSLGRILGPISGGWLLQSFGVGAPLALGAAVVAAACVYGIGAVQEPGPIIARDGAPATGPATALGE